MESISINGLNARFRPDGKIFFTVIDLESFPEWPEGPLLELLHGEIYLVPSPNTLHQDISASIFVQIRNYLNINPVGRSFTAPYDVILSDEDAVIPDIIYVSNENSKIITAKNIRGSPDFIIEIVSTNRKRDFIDKRDLYEKSGVKEYWVVDPKDEIIYKFVRNNQGIFDSPSEHTFKDTIQVESIKGFSITLHG